ncbi:tumor necrosis factor receptor superfamily member 1B [Phyllopteryx taeniolatus]|uniref:tumor necrosis factor receptor superfamily member 1B n=1 Tax=Phyllopteryx taeniolatus TaxID=161469 RepID=UPI002AD41234|nr:tumor necrosis factor receptor superfamily member 1B [Phyllopteryx taeniolatus]
MFPQDAMKDILVLLVMLLDVHTFKVLSLPYHAESNTKCKNPDREYLLEALGLCCKKCPPGMRLTRECNRTSESVCEPCEREQYMESWNYVPNCFPCAKCKAYKGLQFAHNCSSTAMSKCACRLGMYCIMESDEKHCTGCQHYTSCKAGYGVSVPGTAYSNVKCKQCRNGTFSDTSSSKEPCRPHTNCHGRPVLRQGTSTSDTFCKPGPLQTSGHPNRTTTMSPLSVVSGTVDSFLGPVVLEGSSSSSLTKSPKADGELGAIPLAAVASIVATVVFFVIVAIFLLVLYKTTWTKGTANLHPKDAPNENFESGNEFETLRTSFAAISPGEQRRLLQSTEGSCDSSHCGGGTRSSHSSQESIGAVQSTLALRHPQDSPPGSGVYSCSVCPVSAGPHVNVTITFNIGDGGSPSPPGDSELHVGQEEESFRMPKQEAGKELPDQESVE